MGELPSGNVTFLFTDVEGSTQLLERDSAGAAVLLGRHHDILRQSVESHDGRVFETFGDAVCAAFSRPSDAIAAALAGQRALLAERWPRPGPIRVRMALHTGEVELRGDEHYIGAPLFRVARLMSIGHGGQVLLSGVTASLARGSLPAAASLTDLGSHRLRDLAEPEQVWQLNHPELPAGFPALKSLDSLPHNLPVQLTSFVGREKQLEEVKRLLQACRLLTITGAGGSGKTRLALQAAADVLDHFADGAWLVDMSALSEGRLVSQTVARALGVQEEPGQPIQSTLLHWLNGKALLLVLDNCEHLVDASARLAEAILRSCPHVQVVATSRAALGIGGETTWRIPSLDLADPDHLPPLDSLTQYEAVRLFIERAVSAQPNFAVNNQNAPAVAQICHHLDGIPLAIELAAARVRVLSPDQIAARLGDRFQLLTGGSRTALPRQQTLRAMVDWSHELLSEHEKALFRRLSVFAGGWTLEAAETVCAGEPVDHFEVLDLLTALIDKSLIVADDQQGGQVRYRLLETLRQYGSERLAASGEVQHYEEGHVNTFLTLAQDPRGRPGELKGQWLDEVEREHDNFRALLTRLRGRADAGDMSAAEEGLQLVKHLARFWIMRQHWAEAREWIGTFLRYTELRSRRPGLYAHVLFQDAFLAHAQGDYTTLKQRAEESYRVASEVRPVDDPEALEAMCGARWMEAMYETHTGNWANAETIAWTAIQLRDRLGLDKGDSLLTEPHMTYAHALIHQGKYSEAIQVATDAAALAKQHKDKNSEGYAQATLGVAYLSAGNLPEARAVLEESIGRQKDINGTWRAIATNWLGDVAHLQGDAKEADTQYKEALRIGKRVGARRFVANALRGLAAVHSSQSRHKEAATLLGASEKVRREANTVWLPPERQQFDSTRETARQKLADQFQQAWDEGSGMSMDHAADYALQLQAP